LADPVAPFAAVNENDSRAAWSFTLLHELVHLWLGQTGVSGYDGDEEVERFCDGAAARFLLHPGELSQLAGVSLASLNELKSAIDAFAGERKLSRKMVAYNLLRSDTGRYRQLSDLFDAERLTLGRTDGEGRAGYYVVRRHRVGRGLVDLVRRLLAGGELSTTQAGRVLGVKATNVSRLLQHGRAG
jgi:hypothetical protein